jgi:hypothetical protein
MALRWLPVVILQWHVLINIYINCFYPSVVALVHCMFVKAFEVTMDAETLNLDCSWNLNPSIFEELK